MSLNRYQDVQEIVNGDPFTNNGSLMENAVANALHRKGYPLYYYAKKNSTLEVDFVMKYDNKVISSTLCVGQQFLLKLDSLIFKYAI